MTTHEWEIEGPPEFQMQLVMFLRALEKDDFTTGDSFWIGEWEFTVTNCSPFMKKVKGVPDETTD